ncbi:Putative coenzyme F420-dependent oxidoreductase [bacterium HR23]|nr:Putative coenzyme F420-dependent oxidoreductase [bacterium HR23]
MKVYAPLRGRTLAEVPAEARRAEALGYDGVTLSELTIDPFLASTLALEHTQRTRVGTAIAVAFPRSPMIVAYEAWNLQAFSQGRFELGLGTQVKGHNERRFSVPWSAPGPRIREYVQALRAIWDCWQNGTPLNFQGQHYTFTLMTPEFNPGPIAHPRIPILLASVNPYMARLAGEVADGVLLHGFMTWKYIAEVALPAIEAGAKKAGKTFKDVEVSGGGFIVTGATEEEVLQNLEVTRRRIAFYASTRTYKAVMDLHGWGDVTLRLHQLTLQGRWKELPTLITDQMLDAFCVVGTYDSILPRLKEKYAGWATRIAFPMPNGEGPADASLKRLLAGIKAL